MRSFWFLSFLFLTSKLFSQELNCSVTVLSPQILTTDKRVFESLETQIRDFMNNTKWTNDVFQPQERVECIIQINVSEKLSTDEFQGSIQVQARRPVYKTSYNSTLFNYNDETFQFRYIESQPFEFSPQTHISNLTSVLAYYAYIILGLDYDSFSLYGGTLHYQSAQKIVVNAQNANEKGWKSFESNKNRYWLVENMLNKRFSPLRDCIYNYHRNGLDIMGEKKDEARTNILQSLEGLRTLHNNMPLSFNMQLFFIAKADELVNIFSQAYSNEKTQVVNLLNEIDPGNGSKYQKIISSSN